MNFKNKIFYHGSNNKFITFDKSKIKENKLGLCFNFTDNYSLAYQYGDNILKVKLDLNNPITSEIMKSKWTYEQDELLAKKLGFPSIPKEEFEENEYFADVYKIFKMDPRFIELLEEMGYDGIAFPEEHHFGVFEPEQIYIIDDMNEAGYDWNKGMSNNAVDAYNNGEIPLSKWNKKLLLDTFQKELNNIDNYTQNL